MAKTIVIILTLAGFASGAEMEVTDRLSVDGSTLLKSTLSVRGRVDVQSGVSTAYSLTVSTSAAYNFVVSTTGNVGIGASGVSGARLAIIGSTDTAQILSVGTSTAYSFVVSTTGRVSAPEMFQSGNKVVDTSMLDDFTVKFSSNMLKVADRIELNSALLAFKMAVRDGLVKFNMVNGMMDEFADETGVDTASCVNQVYDNSGNYYHPSGGALATGGTITNVGGKIIHTFTTSGNFVVSGSGSVDVLIVGGGGGGGGTYSYYGAGGGAGGFRKLTGETVTAQTYPIVVGTGGAGGIAANSASASGTAGNASSALGNSSAGGGGGGNYYPAAGGDGGSGGGGGYGSNGGAGNTPFTTPDQGKNGGLGVLNGVGGGGGASSVGGNGVGSVGGNGGNGTADSSSGASVTYAGGGGGSGSTPGSGGSGGGGNAGLNGVVGQAGTNGLGGGGGGGGGTSSGGKGGDGVVIISYTTLPFDNMTLVSNATTAEAGPNNVRIVLFEQDVDALTVNTDINAYVSIDSGANYDLVALSDEGDYNGSIRILSGTVDVSTRTGRNIKWKITTHNTKNLKLHAVGLNWD